MEDNMELRPWVKVVGVIIILIMICSYVLSKFQLL